MNPTDATERLLQLANDADAQPSDPGVYALEITLPDTEADVKAAWRSEYDDDPPYLHRLIDCRKALYVGAAKNVRARIDDHVQGDYRKASLPTAFGVHWLREVRWHDDADAAFQAEYNAARDIDRQTPPTTYVHSR